MVGVHAAFTCSDETLDAAADLAADLGVGVHIHVAEGESTATRRPAAALATETWLLAHGVHLDGDLPGTIAHNPRSNMNNAVGYARPRASEPVVLGTDGIGADMLEEFRLAYVRHRDDDVSAVARDGVVVARQRVAARARGPQRRGEVVVRDDGPVAPRVHDRACGPSTWRSTARWCSATARPTRVDASEVRAKAAEQAARLHRLL